MRHAGIRRAAHAGARPVVETVTHATEEGPAAMNAFRRAHQRVETVRRTDWVLDGAAVGVALVSIRQKPVAAPLPDIAGHVVEAVAVGRKGLHRRGAGEAVLEAVAVRKISLEVVALRALLGERLVAPDVFLVLQA